MMTLKAIFQQLARFPASERDGMNRFDRAEYVKVTKFTHGINQATKRYVIIARTQTPENRDGRSVLDLHVSEAVFLDNANVLVSCSCPDFTYAWEVALARKGAAEIRHSNGDLPNTSNPRYIPGCCKHIVALANQGTLNGSLTTQFTRPPTKFLKPSRFNFFRNGT